MTVFNYHAYRSALTSKGSVPSVSADCAGLQDLTMGKITHAGVPLHHIETANFIKNNGQKIVRTMNANFNLINNPPYDLGKIILDFKSESSFTLSNLGSFFYKFVNEVQSPCDGLAMDFEFFPLDLTMYPKTAKDQEICYYWGTSLATTASTLSMRCRQFATIFRLMIYLLKKFKFPNLETNIVYSGYDGLLYSNQDIKTRYGCNVAFLSNYASWRSIPLPKPDYVQCAWHTTIDLPVNAVDRIFLFPLPIIHNICLSPALHSRENIALQIANRIGLLRSQDTIGTVEQGYPNYPVYIWNQENKMVCEELGKQLM